jgi:hypothetical protein
MHRCGTSTALLLTVSLLPACSTLVGQEISRNMLEMDMDGARVAFHAPAHCTPPSYEAEIRPGPGVSVTVMTIASGGLGSTRFRIVLDPGASFAFSSTSGRVAAPGEPGMNASISGVSVIRNSHVARAPAPVDGVMSGSAPAGDRSVYEGDVSAPGFAATAFSLQLPDALIDGVPYRFPPIRYRTRRLTWFQDACLR